METQTVGFETPLPPISATERRRYPRTLSEVHATVRSRDGVGLYLVRNLSVCGALFTEGPSLDTDTLVEVDLRIPDHRQIRVVARVTRHGIHDGGAEYFGVEFVHRSSETEDAIQEALLDEIERSQTHGVIPILD